MAHSRLMVPIFVLALAWSVRPAVCAESTSPVRGILEQHSAKSISSEQASEGLLDIWANDDSVSLRIEAADSYMEKFYHLEGAGLTVQDQASAERARINQFLSFRDSLSGEHQASLSSLRLGLWLSAVMRPSHILSSDTHDDIRRYAATRTSLLEQILDADPDSLVSEHEIAVAKSELDKLRMHASELIMSTTRRPGDSMFIEHEAVVTRLMSKYADNEDVQRRGDAKLNEIMEIRRRMAQLEAERTVQN